MHTIPGYTISEILDDQRSVLLRATRGGRRVLLRTLPKGPLSSEEQSRVRYGCKLSEELDLPGVLKALGIERHGDTLVVVLEDFDGQPLRLLLAGGPLDLLAALHIAAGTARVLGDLHLRGVIHGDVTPSNLLVSADLGQVKLANLDLASRLAPEGHLADLSSLGVIFYEMLTGKAPVAAQPEPPHIIRPTFPRAISDVVMKLLSKKAEERYQSAKGALADLRECLTQLQTTGTITDFVLGAHDASPVFHAPDKLYGRAEEEAALRSLVARVSAGETALVLVSGDAGVGKSSLASEARRMILARQGLFAAGRFDPHASAPYSAVREAIGALVGQVLSQSGERIASLRAEVARAVGALGGVIADVIPEARPLLGPTPEAPPLGPLASERRFRLMFPRFIQAFAQKDRPLALFFDDLERADPSSLDLIKLLAGDPRSAHMLLICAYREGEGPLPGLRDLPSPACEIALEPLTLADVARLLADTLSHTDEDACRALAGFVFDTTGGNPLFIHQLLRALAEQGLVTFAPEEGRFVFRIDRIRATFTASSVTALLGERRKRLAPRSERAARLAACLGSSFDLDMLARILGETREGAAVDLWEAAQRGLILPIGDGYKYFHGGSSPDEIRPPPAISYTFSHDLVRETAYLSIPVAERQSLHLQIGRHLLEQRAGVFEIVGHQNLGRDLLQDRSARLDLARLNLRAGEQARARSATASARVFFTIGVELLQDGPPDEGDLALRLLRGRAACELALGDFDAGLATLRRALTEARSREEKVALYSLKLTLAMRHGRIADATTALREGLSLYELALPDDHEALLAASSAELARLTERLAGRDLTEAAASAGEAEATDDRALIALLARAFVDIAHTGEAWLWFLSLTMVNRSLERGNAAGSALGYVGYSALLGDDASAARLGALSLSLGERHGDLEALAVLRFYLGSFVSPWRGSLRASLPLLDAAFEDAISAGSLVYAGLSATQGLCFRLLVGDELYGLQERSAELHDLFLRAREDGAAAGVAVYQRAIMLLTRGGSPEGESDPQEPLLALEIALLFGDHPSSRAALVRAEEARKSALVDPIAAARVEVSRGLLAAQPVERCPETFLPYKLLIDAQIARSAGRDSEAMELYDRAIEAASSGELVRAQGLANELAAGYYLGKGRRRIARVYLADARLAYSQWGADAVVRSLERRYEELSPGAPLAGGPDDDTAIIKASQAISGEIAFGPLLTTWMRAILELSSAQRAQVILKEPNPEVVLAEKADDGSVTITIQPGHASGHRDLGRAIPVTRGGAPLGVLYLENNQATSTFTPFTPERARAIEILCAQAAISLENARRHGALEGLVTEQANQLAELRVELSQTQARLKLQQKQLIMQEKLASLGALTSGIAHEIKNPLNFVNNFAELSVTLTRDLLEELSRQRARLDPESLGYIEEIGADLRQNAAKINEHGKRADHIVRAMLEHSRTSGGEPREVDVNALLKEYLSLAYQGLRAQNPAFNVSIDASYDPALPPVRAIPQDLGRVFLNLINNACYAAFARKKELGGRFSPRIVVSTRRLPGEIELRFQDNGAGIPAAVKDDIWSAFFTTKPPGEGTGLGLSISHEIIVQGNGGTITFETEDGVGTEFIVTLPCAGQAPR